MKLSDDNSPNLPPTTCSLTTPSCNLTNVAKRTDVDVNVVSTPDSRNELANSQQLTHVQLFSAARSAVFGSSVRSSTASQPVFHLCSFGQGNVLRVMFPFTVYS